MCEHKLDQEHIEKLLSFRGYGNPGGRFWFIGMEEYGSGYEGLWIRATKYEEIEDLARGHSPDMLNFDMSTLIPTWATMSKIVLRFQRSPSWSHTDTVRAYQSQRLGRRHGDSFLTEVLPLPSPSAQAWEWNELFNDRDRYVEAVLPGRIELLKCMVSRYRPQFVFCYGKANWEIHQEIFPEIRFADIASGKAKMGRTEDMTVFLTPFFAWFHMTNQLIDEVARAALP